MSNNVKNAIWCVQNNFSKINFRFQFFFNRFCFRFYLFKIGLSFIYFYLKMNEIELTKIFNCILMLFCYFSWMLLFNWMLLFFMKFNLFIIFISLFIIHHVSKSWQYQIHQQILSYKVYRRGKINFIWTFNHIDWNKSFL